MFNELFAFSRLNTARSRKSFLRMSASLRVASACSATNREYAAAVASSTAGFEFEF